MPLDDGPATTRETAAAYRTATVVLLLLAGILAGTQLGKIAPLVDWYRDAVGMSLVAVGWLAALIGFFVAFAAFPSGLVIDRFGGWRVFTAASAVLFVGGLGVAAFASPAAVLAARLVEGAGYLFLCVVIPALVAEIAPPRLRGPALAVWGGFVPIGFAVGAFLARSMLPAFAPPAFLLAATCTFAVFATPAALLLARIPQARRSQPASASEGLAMRRSLSPALAALALSFGCYVMQSLAFFTFLPAFADESGGRLLVTAGAIALFVPLGNFLAGAAIGTRGGRFIGSLIAVGFVVGAAVAPSFYGSPDGRLATAAAIVFALSGGLVASAQFAVIPFILPPGGSPAVAIGFVAQVGGIATLIAPPLAAFLVERFGWPALGWGLAIAGLAGAAAALPLMRRRA